MFNRKFRIIVKLSKSFMSVLETVHALLSLAIESGASDVHINSNKPAFLRLNGGLDSVEMNPRQLEMNLKGIFLSGGAIVN